MRNVFKRTIAGLCTAALAVSAAAVSAFADEAKVYEATKENVKLLGRTLYNKDSLWLANSTSGVEFTTDASKVTFNLVATSSDDTRIAILVNDKVEQIGNLGSKNASVTVELTGDSNVVKFMKLSEAANTEMAIADIEADGTITPTEAKEHKIEFIGDSITCGYGVEDENKAHSFKTTTENGALAYGYQTALLFGADVNIYAQSGNGIYCNYGGARTNLLKDFYEKCTNFSWSTVDPDDYVLMQSFDWDFSYQPDLIVINLGTNDWSGYFSKHPDDGELYRNEYVEFIKQIRKSNPNAHIMGVLGIMGDDLYPEVEKAVKAYTEETKDENVSAFHLTPQDSEKNGLAADWHPTFASHKDAANEMKGFITETLGWTAVEPAEEWALFENNMVFGDFHDNKKTEESSSQPESEVSQPESTPDSTGESKADDSSKAADSKATESKAASNNTTSNPATGTAAGLALIAVMGGAVIAVKKRK